MHKPDEHPVHRRTFLKDVFITSLGAYGGPESHLSVILDRMVMKKRYLTEEELLELVALCSILPGPTSSQTLVSIGHKLGGPGWGFWAMVVWSLPVLLVMTALSFLYQFLSLQHISHAVLRYIGPMAVGFIIVATWRITRKVITDLPTVLLMAGGGLAAYFIRAAWIFPAVLIGGGLITILLSREKGIWNRVRVKPPWIYLILFTTLALGTILLASLTENRFVNLFERFYRYGYLVFGGGQVVVPVMHSDLVQHWKFMTDQEFLTGYGLVQGLPGPMFSFAAYAGGMVARGGSALRQVFGAVAGGVGIFLPGLLLIYFVYPVWEGLKQIRAVRISLRGINAVAGGLIAVSAVILMRASGFQPDGLAATALAVGLLAWGKIPAPLIVLFALCAGIVF